MGFLEDIHAMTPSTDVQGRMRRWTWSVGSAPATWSTRTTSTSPAASTRWCSPLFLEEYCLADMGHIDAMRAWSGWLSYPL